MRSLIIYVLIASLALAASTEQDKCRGLVLSGGGDVGSYQAGVLTTLIDELESIDTQYDVVSGVSVGSLNGAAISLFPKGEEQEFKEFIMDIWHSVKTSTVFKLWPGGIKEGIFDRIALFDNEPLKDLLREKMSDKVLERTFIAGTCDTDAGTFEAFRYEGNQQPLSDHMFESILASSAMPGIFPPTLRDGKVLLDGGMVWTSDINSAIAECRSLGFEDENIIIDHIMCDETHLLPEEEVNLFHSLKTGLRALNIQSFYNHMQNVEREMILFPHVDFRYTIGPSESLMMSFNPVPLDFSREHLEHCIKVGTKDALNAIALGPGGYKNLLLEFFHNLEEGKTTNFDGITASALGTTKFESQ
jgi:predicted acylesterase/phospholipase RssA